jgi:hypothetical protein
MPMITPIETTARLPLRTVREMSLRFAPSATRMPSSRVRCEHEIRRHTVAAAERQDERHHREYASIQEYAARSDRESRPAARPWSACRIAGISGSTSRIAAGRQTQSRSRVAGRLEHHGVHRARGCNGSGKYTPDAPAARGRNA